MKQRKMIRKEVHRIEVGTRFRWTIADGNPEWEIIEDKGNGCWLCEVCAHEPDYAGTQRAFLSKDIATALNSAAFWRGLQEGTEDFYKTIKPGDILHYHNGFQSFVRCRVNDKRELVPIALVGKWMDIDLPKRQVDGTIYRPHHAQNIMDGKPFTPNGSSIYECPQYARKADSIDPRRMVPVSLEVPPMTPAQEKKAVSWRKFYALKELINNTPWNDPDEAMKAIVNYLK